jgi:hypothetical protein
MLLQKSRQKTVIRLICSTSWERLTRLAYTGRDGIGPRHVLADPEGSEFCLLKACLNPRSLRYGVQKSPGSSRTCDAACSRRLAIGSSAIAARSPASAMLRITPAC